MSFLEWTALTSGALLLMAFASSYVRDLPVTTSALYLGLGLVIGPLGFDVISLDVIAPGGILRVDANGAAQSYTVQLRVDYSPTGAGTWSLLGTMGNNSAP